jgi:hypothetical protein
VHVVMLCLHSVRCIRCISNYVNVEFRLEVKGPSVHVISVVCQIKVFVLYCIKLASRLVVEDPSVQIISSVSHRGLPPLLYFVSV